MIDTVTVVLTQQFFDVVLAESIKNGRSVDSELLQLSIEGMEHRRLCKTK